MHNLWLGYISELLNLHLRYETEAATISEAQKMTDPVDVAGPSSMPLDVPEPIQKGITLAQVPHQGPSEAFTLHQMQIWQGKLVKADFHGCDVEGNYTPPL